MPRKVFLSFLGTNYYLKTRYFFDENCKEKSEPTHFVQYYTIKETCRNWSSNDKIFIFLTKDAEIKNWKNPAQEGHKDGSYTGLSRLLSDLNLKAKIEPQKEIPEGFAEEEIWELFKSIVDLLEPDDELYIDITHAFRYLPMLVMVLLNYAKVVYNIKVKHIYYGAFEKLGPSSEVKKIPVKDRFAQVLDLVSFSELQEWTNASNGFIKFGNAEELIKLTESSISPILKETKGADKSARAMNLFSKRLLEFNQDLRTNRGLEILIGKKADGLKNAISALKGTALPTLEPLLDKISCSIDGLDSSNDVINGFRAVKWCLDVNLIQQAYSLLREAVISYVLYSVFPEEYNNWLANDNKRELVSSAFKIISEEIDKKDWNENAKKNDDFVCRIIAFCFPKELIKEYDSLGNIRNDIMHAGFRNGPSNADKIQKKIKDSLNKIINLLNISL